MLASTTASAFHPRRPIQLQAGGALAMPLVLGLALGLPQAPASAQSLPTSPLATRCATPQPGRYVVIGDGDVRGEPVARILQETWRPDGSLSGLRLERRGRIYREVSYRGTHRPLSLCRVAIEREYPDAGGVRRSSSQAVLDDAGRPRYSLGTLADVVVGSRWFGQAGAACAAGLLDGTVLSMQSGRVWSEGRWRPIATVQHERWRDGRAEGITISSDGQRIEEATYDAVMAVGADCLATLKRTDSLGVAHRYRAVLLDDGSGYVVLQTDPDNLTLGFLEHRRPATATGPRP